MKKRRKIKRVLLINPPSVCWNKLEVKRADYPLGLGYIASMLKLEGFEVGGLDAILEGFDTEEPLSDKKIRYGLTDEEIKKWIDDFKPDAVGVSNMFSNGLPMSLHTCRLVKEVDPNIVVVLGGTHPSTLPADCLKQGDMDYIVIGEGDYTMGLLLRSISYGRDLNRIPGIAFRDDKGNPVVNPFIEPIQCLDILPFPDRELFSIYRYSTIGQPHGNDLKYTPYTTFITSRGCPFRCSFCATFNVHGRQFRARSAENVLDEIEFLVKKMGVREIHFEDDNLTFDRKRAEEIFKGIIKRKLDIAWIPSSGLAFYTLDRELLTLMREAGCYTLWIPVETGDEETLRRIRKPTKIEKFRELVPIVKELGFTAKGLFMYGFPWETVEQMEKTFKFAEELNLDYATFTLATPLPGTDLWKEAVEINPELKSPDFDWERLKFGISNLSITGLSREELQKIRRKIWLKVNWNLGEDEEPPS